MHGVSPGVYFSQTSVTYFCLGIKSLEKRAKAKVDCRVVF